MRSSRSICLLFAASVMSGTAITQASEQHWVTSWTGAAQGPYPSGYASAQPNLKFTFPDPAMGAHDQTFRLIVHPDYWGRQTRLRFSNVFGTKPVTFNGVFVGLRAIAGTIVPGTTAPVHFAGKPRVVIQPGTSVWSDPVTLTFVGKIPAPYLTGRKLAVSFHIVGDSGPMTWHAKGLTTSYVSQPGAGSVGRSNTDDAFPYTTASWYFLDALDMMAPADTHTVVAFGDSITDGTDSTFNGDDRWPDQLQRRLAVAYGSRVVIVNEGIGGDQVLGPLQYSAAHPFVGGPSAEQRLDRDAISLSGVSTVIFMEGINDIGKTANASPQAVESGIRRIVRRLHKARPGIKVIGVTLTPNLHSTNPDHGSTIEDAKRKQINVFIRTSHVFDSVLDFAPVVADRKTGGLKPQYIPDSTIGGPGDGLHPDHGGYQAMADSVNLTLLKPN